MGTTTFQTPSQAGVFAVRGCIEPAPVWTADIAAVAGAAATYRGTGLPTAVRLRVPATGVPAGRPVVGENAVGTPKDSTTPGDHPPRDPLS